MPARDERFCDVQIKRISNVQDDPAKDGVMRAIAGIVVLSTMLASVASATDWRVPAKFYRVDGRPVPVSCLETLVGPEDDTRTKPIDLQTCGNTELKPKVQADGAIGYDIPSGGYFYYSYIGQSGDIDILSLQSSGGGSGHFTQLIGVRHGGHLVRWVKDIAGGDRCNGGISDETIAKGGLSFDQAITPYDLIALAAPGEHLKAYHDLEDSAASCIGSVHRVGEDKHWTGVSFTDEERLDQKGWTDQYTYQACFNTVYREAVHSRHVELNHRGVIMFARAFAMRCLKTH